MNKNIRFVSVLALSAMAVASQAVGIFLQSNASGVGVTAPPTSFTSTVTSNGSDSPFSAILVGSTVAINFTGGANSTATYTSSLGNVTFGFNSAADDLGTGNLSFASPASIIAGTNFFSQFVGATGLTASSTTNTANNRNGFTIAGNPTPEPASIAALGVGALALLRRRRKA